MRFKPKIESYRIKKKDLPTKTTVTSEQAKDMLRSMLIIRRMEITCDTLYK